MQLHRVDSLRDTQSEITFLCEPSRWIGGKERKRSRRENGFLPLNTKSQVLCQKKKAKKPWLLCTLGRNDTSLWPSLDHQAFTNTAFVLQADGQGACWVTRAGQGLQHGVTQCHPDDSSTSQGVVWIGLFAFFQLSETPVIELDRYLAPKGERKMDAIVRVWRRQTPTCAQIGSV